MKKVSYQGVQGAYSQSAAKKFFGEDIETLATKSFEDALKFSENEQTSEDINYSILPVENSIEGTVGQSIDVVTNTSLNSIGEVYLKIIHVTKKKSAEPTDCLLKCVDLLRPCLKAAGCG